MIAEPQITAGLIAEQLEAAASSFATGELAYLALTSKVELPLRDRLAWSLHTALPEFVVAREWHRSDLAVLDLDARIPHALIEAKAMYSFDVARADGPGLAAYTSKIAADLNKARDLARDAPTGVFGLAFVTHPQGAPPHLPNVIKYISGIRGALRLGTETEVRQAAAANLSSALRDLGPVLGGRLDAGEAFGVNIAIDYWIVGPA
ncbi:hypothetical protein ACIRU8_43005 [Streptomyces sp. NPDC101175]|uniref:hypothetical protein n=1 Tax=Streptomyces sp. NPDC101175 TaxID=3366123 RepID=UPI003833F934